MKERLSLFSLWLISSHNYVSLYSTRAVSGAVFFISHSTVLFSFAEGCGGGGGGGGGLRVCMGSSIM